MGLAPGLTLGVADTLLTDRAADYLAAGPADPQALISHVCQLPGAPLNVAEHMAAALFAGHRKFARDTDGRWRLRESMPSAPTWPVAPAVAGLHQEPFIVVDVETTGTSPHHGDRVTEVAAVRVCNGEATLVFDSLINPERSIPPAIIAITNITWEMVKDAPKFSEVCDQLLGVLEGHVFVAHNASFDWRFISAEVERATRRPLEGRTLCTVRLARKLLPQLRRRNLDSVTRHYGIDIGARHRAGGDAFATAQVLLRLLDAARDRECNTLDDVERLLRGGTSRPKRPRRPPAMPHSASDDSSA
ncbi:MAG: polymerase epsilon subunit [Gemmatimonadetes bacterium]|nr:polymerase epsilon subunit [Gemmatimonadota bacterium]